MSESSTSKFIALGQVGRPRGLRGDFFVSGREDVWPTSVRRVWLGEAGVDRCSFKVKSIQKFSQKIAAKLEGINSREELEPYIHRQIWCQRKDIEINHTEEYLWTDLIGLQIIDQNGETVGVVRAFENYGAHDNIVIEGTSQNLELPFVDQYFKRDWKEVPAKIEMACSMEDVAELWSEKK